MNAETRKKLKEIVEDLQELVDPIESMGSDEREKYDSLSDELQDSTVGSDLDAGATTLEEAVGTLQGVIDELEALL
jgi:t-SNARE complex subunit (syntaxin)